MLVAILAASVGANKINMSNMNMMKNKASHKSVQMETLGETSDMELESIMTKYETKENDDAQPPIEEGLPQLSESTTGTSEAIISEEEDQASENSDKKADKISQLFQ